MFIESAHAVADQVTDEQLKLGMLFPPQSNILETEIKTAARVARVVFESNLARVARPADWAVLWRLYWPCPQSTGVDYEHRWRLSVTETANQARMYE
jgi:malate dehydrogenase (oxaloacetate-decarboxylating)(NADP+)